MLPPPHLFLGDLSNQAQYFDTSQVIAGEEARGAAWGVLHSVGATILRVLVGLALGFALAVLVGIGTRYFRLFGKLVLPSVTLLAPVSPLAWLPVAIYTFGTGNGPAVFLVFVAVFFIIVLATISEIDSVSPTYLNVARTMGASRAQTYRLVILPAILPGLFMILRLNLFAAWMIVPGCQVRRRGQRARAGDHDRPQHLQLTARVLHHRDHRNRRLHVRQPAAPGAKADALLAAGQASRAGQMSSAGKIDSLSGQARGARGTARPALRAPGCRLPRQHVLVACLPRPVRRALGGGVGVRLGQPDAPAAAAHLPPRLLRPGQFFDPNVRMSDASPGVIALAVATTVAYSTVRVLTGLALGFAISVSVGMAIRYAPLLGKLVMPTVLLLAPVSPVAWMPVALFVFGIGNAPAIFLVVIALFFIMTLATVSMIDAVSPTYVNVARIMGATRRQIFLQVILPAILPACS